MVSVLPSPEPADPEEGKPGHFAHSNWLKASVKALDGSLTQVDARVNTKSPLGHGHDDLYYTESEINTLLEGKSPTSHLHDEQYYTESEVLALLAGKSDSGHNHDDRYFTETEIAAKFARGTFTTPPLTTDTSVKFTVLFGKTLPAYPTVLITPLTGVSSNLYVTWWVTDITISGFQLNVRRGNTTDMTFNWLAVAL